MHDLGLTDVAVLALVVCRLVVAVLCDCQLTQCNAIRVVKVRTQCCEDLRDVRLRHNGGFAPFFFLLVRILPVAPYEDVADAVSLLPKGDTLNENQ